MPSSRGSIWSHLIVLDSLVERLGCVHDRWPTPVWEEEGFRLLFETHLAIPSDDSHPAFLPPQCWIYKQDSRLLCRLPVRSLKATPLDTRRIKIAASEVHSPPQRRVSGLVLSIGLDFPPGGIAATHQERPLS